MLLLGLCFNLEQTPAEDFRNAIRYFLLWWVATIVSFTCFLLNVTTLDSFIGSILNDLSMANIALLALGSLLRAPVKLRSLVANNNQVTQISDRLANQLGLMNNSHGVYVSPGLGGGGSFQLKWRLSSFPMIITGLPEAVNQTSYAVYPVINTNNSFYDMIIGADCFEQNFDVLNFAVNDRSAYLPESKPWSRPYRRCSLYGTQHSFDPLRRNPCGG